MKRLDKCIELVTRVNSIITKECKTEVLHCDKCKYFDICDEILTTKRLLIDLMEEKDNEEY